MMRSARGPSYNSGKASCFDFPDQLQRRPGKAAAGGIERKDGSQTVAGAQHRGVGAMGGRVAQQLFEFLALSDEVRRVGHGPGEQKRRVDAEDAGKYGPLIVFAGVGAKIGLFGRAGIRDEKDLKAKALSALHRLQKLPHVIRGFFSDPELRYITA